MLILSANQIQELDRFTILNEPITSIDLMERAAMTCSLWICKHIETRHPIHVFSGPGNNGGDGLAIARLLANKGFKVKATLLKTNSYISSDCKINLDRLAAETQVPVEIITESVDFGDVSQDTIIIDALLGTGLNRPAEGIFAECIQQINARNLKVIAIDIPSGLSSDKGIIKFDCQIIKAEQTLTFQYLKFGLLMPTAIEFTGKITVLDIGLLAEGLADKTTPGQLTTPSDIMQLLKIRNQAGHKGTFGHAVLMAGGSGKAGAGILAARSCLRSGCGLVTMIVPEQQASIFQVAVPEAMCITYEQIQNGHRLPSKLTALGAGPGIGTDASAMQTLRILLQNAHPMILDADSINLIASNPELKELISAGSILTPHPGEFERLAGQEFNSDSERIGRLRAIAAELRSYILLKGPYSIIASPEGSLQFNPTGNAGMAKGGSGDVLTGLITGLTARGYNIEEAGTLGMYLHGLAGDLCAKRIGQEAMNAGDLIDLLPEAWKLAFLKKHLDKIDLPE